MSTVLAADIGGSSVRAALVDTAGEIVALHRCPAPPEFLRGGQCEIDPEEWWSAFAALATALAHDAPAAFDAVEAVAVCGITRTQILLGRDGRPLRPAITWRDARAESGIAELLDLLPRDHAERERVNAYHPLARLAWLKHNEPALLGAAAAVVEPKDFVNFRLTGRIATDPISSARLLAAAAKTAAGGDLLAACGLPATIVPPLRAPTERVGKVSDGLGGPLAQLANRPVFCLANDTWAAVLGMGALRPGFAFSLSGTTEVFGVVSAAPAAAEGLMAVEWGPGLHQLGGPSQNGADALAWLLELVGEAAGDIGAAMQAVLDQPRDPQPILFLPYLQGERTPYWDAALRGGALGLNRRHTGTDFLWALLEGIAFLNRVVLERAEAAIGQAVDEIRFGGGGSASAIWCQAKADICERTIAVAAADEPGLLGCAIAARVGLGRYASLAAAQSALVRIARRYTPRAEYAAAYRKLYTLYREAERRLRPLSHALSACDGRRERLPGVVPETVTEMQSR